MSCSCCGSHNEELSKKFQCPECKGIGDEVLIETVKSLCEEGLEIPKGTYLICKTAECKVAYYSEDTVIGQEQVKVPIWFKEGAEPKILCYCSNVTEADIDKVIEDNKDANYKEIIKLTGAMQNSDCKSKNPTGQCCVRAIGEYIDKKLSK